MLPSKVPLVVSPRDALIPELLCSIPTKVHTSLEEWCLKSLRAALLLELLQNQCLAAFFACSWYRRSEGLVSRIF